MRQMPKPGSYGGFWTGLRALSYDKRVDFNDAFLGTVKRNVS